MIATLLVRLTWTYVISTPLLTRVTTQADLRSGIRGLPKVNPVDEYLGKPFIKLEVMIAWGPSRLLNI
jgi:hypothetical protein